MGKIAFVFSGQGAQYTGMGQSLADASTAAKEVVAMAEALRPGTAQQCFYGDKALLSQTENTQPCLYTVDLAAAAALAEAGIRPQGAAGFSLGELAALAFAGFFSAADGFSLVCLRARLMQACGEAHPGAMAAVLLLENERVEAIAAAIGDVYPVNYNGPGQLVVAGKVAAVEALIRQVPLYKGKAMKLPVSGAFHSPLMAEAAEAFAAALRDFHFNRTDFPVYANATAEPYDGDCGPLARQIRTPVRWEQTVRHMERYGFSTFIEVGPGKTLANLIGRILPNATVYHVEDEKSLRETIAALEPTGRKR